VQLIFTIIVSDAREVTMAAGDRANYETGVTGLSYGEHLLVWSWRRIITGRGDCPLIAREFLQLCGEDAAEVLATFYTFLQALACAGRRRLQVGYPGCSALTADERQMLVLIAVAQRHDAARLQAHLQIIARAALRPALAIAARALGTALNEHDLRLPLPTPSLDEPRSEGSHFGLKIVMRSGL
jgi:hypothetical protein